METRMAADERAGELLSLASEQAEPSARSWLSKAWFNAGAPLSASPAIAVGKLVIGSQDGKLYCLG